MVLGNTISNGESCFVIRPNRSLTWPQAQLFFLSLATVCLGVAIAFALIGFWPVLPFAGAEVIVLGLAVYNSALSGRETEVVRVTGDVVAVEKGRRQPREVWRFQRAWARIQLLPPLANWYPSRLVIGSHGKLVQLGAFLNEQERQRLAGALTCALAERTGAWDSGERETIQ